MLTNPIQIVEFLNKLLVNAEPLQDAYPLKEIKQTARRLDFYRIMKTVWYGLFEKDFDVNFRLLTITDFRNYPFAWVVLATAYYKIQKLGIKHEKFSINDKNELIENFKHSDNPLQCALTLIDKRYGKEFSR